VNLLKESNESRVRIVSIGCANYKVYFEVVVVGFYFWKKYKFKQWIKEHLLTKKQVLNGQLLPFSGLF